MKCSRRASADRSPPRAIVRRTTGDRRSTGKMAWESQEEFHVRRETMSRPPPRPPPEDDTLALASSLTYAAPRQGSHSAKTLGRDMAPAPCDLRRHDRRADRCCWQGASRRCLRLSASGASVPRARRTLGEFQCGRRSNRAFAWNLMKDLTDRIAWIDGPLGLQSVVGLVQ